MAGVKKRKLLDVLCARFEGMERERLLALVLCGDVRVAGEKLRDPARLIAVDAEITADKLNVVMPAQAASPVNTDNPDSSNLPPLPYVSRGGDKLFPVLQQWQVPVANRVFLDAGSSTGGFTHCLLLQGASLVHAVDVGYNQLDWRLRKLTCVQVHERTNIMELQSLSPRPQAAVADLSFRSIAAPARHILDLVSDHELYALIKPQFERDSQSDGEFKGIRPDRFHGRILLELAEKLGESGVRMLKLAPAGLRGAGGNLEYFMHATLGDGKAADNGALVEENQALVRSFFRTRVVPEM